MEFVEYLKVTELLIGLMLTMVTTGAGFIIWAYRRMRAIAKEANPVDLDTQRRVQQIEVTLGGVKQEVGDIDRRIGTVERRFETMATQSDMAEIRERMSAQEAGQRYSSGMLHSIHEAILRDVGKND